MSSQGWLVDLGESLRGRRFVGVTELEAALPEGLGLQGVEWLFDLLEERELILVDEVRRRPIGFFPTWDASHWEAAEGEMKGGVGPRIADDPAERAHAELLGRDLGGGPEAEEEEAEPDEPLEEPSTLYLKMAQETERLDPEEEAHLVERAVSGDEEARAELLRSYLGRVVFLARRYQKAGANHDDLIQAGNMGLVEALQSFRIGGRRGFSAHADNFIRRAFGRHLAEERRTIRLPRTVDKGIRRLLKVHEEFCKTQFRVPSHKELAKKLGTDEDEVGYLMSYLQAPLSLDAPTAPGEDLRLEETIEDEQAPSPAEWSARIGALERLEELLEDMSVSHRRVVALRYGLIDGVAHTRREVSAKTGFPVDEVVRFEQEALDRLRDQGDLENVF